MQRTTLLFAKRCSVRVITKPPKAHLKLAKGPRFVLTAFGAGTR